MEKFSKKPFVQYWKGKRIAINAMAVTPIYESLQQTKTVYQSKMISKDHFNEISKKVSDKCSGLTFKLYMEPCEEYHDSLYYHNSDVVYGFNRTPEERAQQIDQFNFNLSSSVWVVIDSERVFPTLCHFERNYGLDNGRNIWISFKLDEKSLEKVRKMKSITLYFDNFFPHEGVAAFQWPIRVFKGCI